MQICAIYSSYTEIRTSKEMTRREIDKTDVKIKVREKSGMKIIRHLQRNDPFKGKMCADREKCLVCSGPNPGNCRETGVSYRIDCPDECEYTGQTGLNAYTRGKKHFINFITVTYARFLFH